MIGTQDLERRLSARLAPFVDDALERQPEATRRHVEAHGAGLRVGVCRAPEDPALLIGYVFACVVVGEDAYPFCWVDARNLGVVLSGEPGDLKAHYSPDPITDDDMPPGLVEIPGGWD